MNCPPMKLLGARFGLDQILVPALKEAMAPRRKGIKDKRVDCSEFERLQPPSPVLKAAVSYLAGDNVHGLHERYEAFVEDSQLCCIQIK